MEIKLAENIRILRKERALTQEQLAEILNVTVGAVHKWETGLSVPELKLILEMADYFDTSVDALLGYEMKDNSEKSISNRLEDYLRTMAPEGLVETEKILKKYPNSFDIVLNGAKIYLFYSTGNRNRKNLRRALELLEKSLVLFSQNKDPKIGTQTIYGMMGLTYELLNEHEEALEILKSHNVQGVFDEYIGQILAMDLKRFDEAENYLRNTLLNSFITLFDTAMGYVFVFNSRKDYYSVKEIVQFTGTLFDGLKIESGIDYMDKVKTIHLVCESFAFLKTGEETAARKALKDGLDLAERFDQSPDYSINNIRFLSSQDVSYIHDVLGETAKESIETVVRILDDAEFTGLWKEISGNE